MKYIGGQDVGDAFEFTHDEQNSTKVDGNLLSHDDNDLPLELPEVATLIRSDGTKCIFFPELLFF